MRLIAMTLGVTAALLWGANANADEHRASAASSPATVQTAVYHSGSQAQISPVFFGRRWGGYGGGWGWGGPYYSGYGGYGGYRSGYWGSYSPYSSGYWGGYYPYSSGYGSYSYPYSSGYWGNSGCCR
jgi:hypothetical protein